MKFKNPIILAMLCGLSLRFIKFNYFFTLGIKTVEDVYGRRINYINIYRFHADSPPVLYPSISNSAFIFFFNYIVSGKASEL
jgi:hypothetical protein